MGRKSKPAIAPEKVSTQKPESSNTSLERGETLPETTNPSLKKTKVQAEKQPMAAKITKSTFLYGTSSYAEGKYRSFYIDSRKKIEALTEENRELALKLENALGKLEGCEKVLEMAKEGPPCCQSNRDSTQCLF